MYRYGEHAVAQLVEALRYRPEGRGFDSRWCHRNFSLTKSFRPHYGPGVDSVSNRNEYQEYFLWGKGGRFLGLTTLPPSCADCLEIWESQPNGTLRACPGLSLDCFTFLLIGYVIIKTFPSRICRISRPGVQGFLQGENVLLNEQIILKSVT